MFILIMIFLINFIDLYLKKCFDLKNKEYNCIIKIYKVDLIVLLINL